MHTLYKGWTIVAYTIVCQMILLGVTQTAFGLYVVPVSEEFGLSRADMNLAIVIMNLSSAIVAPVVGLMTDRLPARPMLIWGGILAGLALATIGMSHSLALSAVAIAFFVLGEGLVWRPATALIVRWFHTTRARALMIGAIGYSLAGIAIAPIVGLLIGNHGWRTSLLVSALGATIVVLLPALFLRLTPDPSERERQNLDDNRIAATQPGSPARPTTVAELVRTPAFWCIGIGIALPMSVSQAVVISIVPLAVANGVPLAQAATLTAAAGAMALSGKLGLSIVADRLNQTLLLAGAFCIGAAENLILAAVASNASFYVLLGCAVMQGLSSGMLMPLFNALVAKRFGPASFGTVVGLVAPLIAIFHALFAHFIGEVFDRTGGYQLAFIAFVAVELIAAGLMIGASRLSKPKTANDPDLDPKASPMPSS